VRKCFGNEPAGVLGDVLGELEGDDDGDEEGDEDGEDEGDEDGEVLGDGDGLVPPSQTPLSAHTSHWPLRTAGDSFCVHHLAV
jgi:hypothetical protein